MDEHKKQFLGMFRKMEMALFPESIRSSTEITRSNFTITYGRGFHLTFSNGITVSVQWGAASYSDNYHDEIDEHPMSCKRYCSSLAEVAVWDSDNKMLLDKGEVWGYQTADQIATIIACAVSWQPGENLPEKIKSKEELP